MSTSDFSDVETDVDPLDEAFSQAAEHLQHIHTTLTSTDLTEIYGLYKQAKCGRCNTSKPSVFSIQNQAKWRAWNELGEMQCSEAKRLYVEKVQQLDVEWQPRHKISGTEKCGPSWVVHSIPQPPEETEHKAEYDKNAFDYVKEGNFSKLKETLTTENMQLLDENGMGLIHWASDRNAVEILQHLIEAGVRVDFRDSEQQTPLHYAASCGHFECVRVLLDANADPFIKDGDGQTCFDVADNPDIRKLLKSRF